MFDPNIWVKATINKIKNEKPQLAIIADLRFPTELEEMKKNNGYIIRLERELFQDDHESEIALDGYDWNSYERSIIIGKDNNIDQKNKILLNWFNEEIIPKLENKNVGCSCK